MGSLSQTCESSTRDILTADVWSAHRSTQNISRRDMHTDTGSWKKSTTLSPDLNLNFSVAIILGWVPQTLWQSIYTILRNLSRDYDAWSKARPSCHAQTPKSLTRLPFWSKLATASSEKNWRMNKKEKWKMNRLHKYARNTKSRARTSNISSWRHQQGSTRPDFELIERIRNRKKLKKNCRNVKEKELQARTAQRNEKKGTNSTV